MIISISGKKRSGKDLIGKRIQWLVFQSIFNGTNVVGINNFEEWIKHCDKLDDKTNTASTWKIVKFADKLKDMICLLIGCTREELEDESFKNTILGEEWSKWTIKLNGKWDSRTATFDSEAKAIKHCKNWDNVSIEAMPYLKEYTPREILQYVGTDLFRKQFHPNTWINATMTDYKDSRWISKAIWDIQTKGIPYNPDNNKPHYPNWIITDCRFPNEAKAVKDRGGINIRVNRPGKESNDSHESETALDNYDGFDYIITNDNDIEHLVERIREILLKEKII